MSTSTDPTAAMRAAQEMVRRATADVDRLVADVARLRAGEGDRRARAARDGELGDEWRVVQRRIDEGRTTLAAVFDGTDTSDAAEALRGRARSGLAEAASSADEQQDSGLAELRSRFGASGGPLDDVLRRWGVDPGGHA